MRSTIIRRRPLAPFPLAIMIVVVMTGGGDWQVASVRGDDSIQVDQLIVSAIDVVNVPSRKSGVIAQMDVREGTVVKAGDELARLDDREVRVMLSMAQTQLQIALKKAESHLGADAAKLELAEKEQAARQHEIVREIADRKADNRIRIMAAEKAEAVAKNELERALAAQRQYADSVSQSEIDGLHLAYERSRLETQQAGLQHQIDRLGRDVESEAEIGHRLAIARAKVALGDATATREIEQLQAVLQQQQYELASLTLENHRIRAPFNGVVVQRLKRVGDWVNAGDSVVRVIRLDRLRAEGFVPVDRIAYLKEHPSVMLTVTGQAEAPKQVEGVVVFISPEVDPVNHEVRFWVEFDNLDHSVLPGMRLALEIQP